MHCTLELVEGDAVPLAERCKLAGEKGLFTHPPWPIGVLMLVSLV